MPRRSEVVFTEAFVRSAKPRDGRRSAYFDGATPGLELRVSPGGAKTWAFRYRDASGRTLRLVLGSHPSTGLKKARERALEARRLVSGGGDPQSEKRAQAAAARAQKVRTIRDLAGAFLEAAEARNRPGSVAVDRQRIETHILPKLGGQVIGAVTRSQVRELVNDIGRRGQGVTANRVAALVVRLYRFAADELDMPLENPGKGLQSTFEERSRTRVLNDGELRDVWNGLAGPNFSPLTEQMALCLRLCALTLQRGSEVCGLRIEEVDLAQRIWVIPGARTKNHRDHVVPLSAEAMAAIQQAVALLPAGSTGKAPKAGPLFPSRTDAEASMTRHALTRAMKRLCDKLEITDASPHDLRRTGATNITSERVGMPRFVVSAVLNHVSEMGGVTQVYDRNEYLPEKRRALEAWAKLLIEIAEGKKRSGNVAAFRKKRSAR